MLALPFAPIEHVDRFCSKLSTPTANGCIEWQAARNQKGYGIFGIGRNKLFLAHRLAFEWSFANFIPSMFVLHRCDNPACCEPSHLFQGTNSDNVADMMAKGRNIMGMRVGNSKLSDADIRAIKNDNRVQRIIAEQYGVDQSTISDIKAGQSWRHIT
jgi:hypothetical protein